MTFRGLHFVLKKGLADYKKVNEIIKDHQINIPEITESDIDEILSVGSKNVPSIDQRNKEFYRILLASMGPDGVRNLIEFAVKDYPRDFFGNMNDGFLRSYVLNPLWERNQYIRNLFGKAIHVVFTAFNADPKFSRSKFIDAIGEDSYRMIELFGEKNAPKQINNNEYLSQISNNRKSEILKRLQK